jgi:hypothetical protein
MVRLSPGDLAELFEIYQIPGSTQELEVLAFWVSDLLENKGIKYIKRNRRRLLRDWSNLLEYGLSNI